MICAATSPAIESTVTKPPVLSDDAIEAIAEWLIVRAELRDQPTAAD